MKSLIDLWRITAQELGQWVDTCTARDIKTVVSRCEDEGISFLTITLPDFERAFLGGLDSGQVSTSDFPAFKRGSGCLPAFLSGFTSRVFDVVSGQLLQNPCVDSIFAVRQLCSLVSKIELPCSNSRVVRAMQAYVECEQEVEQWESAVTPEDLMAFRVASRRLWSAALSSVDGDVFYHRLSPRHGPGSTAERSLGNQKYHFAEWTQRLERVFPYGEYALPNWRYYRQLDHVDFLEPGAERPVRVISVPKTLRTPRIIAVEPSYMQYMQQGVAIALVRELEDSRHPFWGMIGFTDQEANRRLAQRGSLAGDLATLDLKEASDRVPHLLVDLMLEDTPWLYAGVRACRTVRAEIPELGICIPRLRKFASMGSALCFPFEAMVFLTVVLMGIAKQRCQPLTRELIKSLRDDVRVFGDDIIVPVDCVDEVISHLTRYGFKVNMSKSFWNGKFRESCGGDYYAGQDVTPVRLKKLFPSSLQDGSRVSALVDFRNRLYLRGLWQTARWLDEWLRILLRGHFPIVLPTSPALGRWSFLPYQEEKTHRELHSPLVRAFVVRPKIPENSIDGTAALMKCLSYDPRDKRVAVTDGIEQCSVFLERTSFLYGGNVRFADAEHLSHSGRATAVATKLKWVSPF